MDIDTQDKIVLTNKDLGAISVYLNFYESGWDYIPEAHHNKIGDEIVKYAVEHYAIEKDQLVAQIKSELGASEEKAHIAGKSDTEIVEFALHGSIHLSGDYFELQTEGGKKMYLNTDHPNKAEKLFVEPLVDYLAKHESSMFQKPESVVLLMRHLRTDPKGIDTVLAHVAEEIKSHEKVQQFAKDVGVTIPFMPKAEPLEKHVQKTSAVKTKVR
nr:hypothetical protein [Achromobacter ruhlandii]